MERKEMFCAVIGGIVGAVLTMTAGSFAPLGAQNGVKDAEFGTITCSGIMVRDKALPGRSVIVGTSGRCGDGRCRGRAYYTGDWAVFGGDFSIRRE